MCVSVFVSVRVSVSLCVHVYVVCGFYCVCICLVSFLVIFFSKTIRVILRYYVLKNPCKREESLLGILSLENQTSFSYN